MSSFERASGLRAAEGVAAVVVPVYRAEMSASEQLSLRHLTHFLGRYDRYFVAPGSLEVSRPGFRIKRFEDKYFKSTATYSSLLVSRKFYRAFAAYKFILLYQLDALVFSDQLLAWCERGWDYIGAPWIKCDDAPFVESPVVGNGGFSLRKVESFLRVINSLSGDPEFGGYAGDLRAAGAEYDPGVRARLLGLTRRTRRRLGLYRDGEADAPIGRRARKSYGSNEDCFWSFDAPVWYPAFKVAPVEEAVRFSFEVEPRRCYAMNGNRLPFGCHAWERYDREFWEPFLLK